jgi:hypothetical protein
MNYDTLPQSLMNSTWVEQTLNRPPTKQIRQFHNCKLLKNSCATTVSSDKLLYGKSLKTGDERGQYLKMIQQWKAGDMWNAM